MSKSIHKILIVDDDSEFAEHLAGLMPSNYQIKTAYSLKQAMEQPFAQVHLGATQAWQQQSSLPFNFVFLVKPIAVLVNTAIRPYSTLKIVSLQANQYISKL